MPIDIKTVQCPQCGSTDIEMNGTRGGYGVCRACGSQVLIYPHAENETHYHVGTGTLPEDIKVSFVFPNDYDAKQCQKIILRRLIEDDDAPIDVLEASFSGMTLQQGEILQTDIEAMIHYTVEIGNDYEEQYLDKESYYDTDTNQHRTRTVVKTRKVTKWTPMASSSAAEAVVHVSNNESPFSESAFDKVTLLPLYSETAKSRLVAIQGIEPSFSAQQNAKTAAKAEMDWNIIKGLPGDHHRNYRSSMEIRKTSESVWVCPLYSMQLKYQDHEYSEHCYATMGGTSWGETIPNPDGAKKILDDLEPRIYRRTHVFRLASVICLIAYVVAMVLSLMNKIPHSSLVTIGGFIVTAALFIPTTVLYYRNRNKASAEINEEHEQYVDYRKRKLEEKLAAM